MRGNFLFGLKNHDWVEQIGEMFSKKLQSLRIENHEHFHLQKLDQIMQLMKVNDVFDNRKQLGKNFSETDCALHKHQKKTQYYRSEYTHTIRPSIPISIVQFVSFSGNVYLRKGESAENLISA